MVSKSANFLSKAARLSIQEEMEVTLRWKKTVHGKSLLETTILMVMRIRVVFNVPASIKQSSLTSFLLPKQVDAKINSLKM